MSAENNYNLTIRKIYDEYFGSDYYNHRYPGCNPTSLSMILDNVYSSPANSKVMDFGCGNGRYIFPLLEQTNADIVAYDISSTALEQLKNKLDDKYDGRVIMCGKSTADIDVHKPYNTIISMFGVMSHIPSKSARLIQLRHFYRVLDVNGKLILSVPNSKRRFYIEQFKHAIKRAVKKPVVPAGEKGDIIYARTISRNHQSIFYHLFNAKQIKNDIESAGFHILSIKAESILPEKIVVSSVFFGKIDRFLVKILPAFCGYGILVSAVKERPYDG